MSHELYEDDSIAYAGATPWHGIGVFVGDEPVDSQEMIVKAGLNWRVMKQPCVATITHQSTGQVLTTESQEHFMVVRNFVNDPNRIAVIGTVGREHTSIQNADMFREMDQFVENGDIRYEVAGSLKNGRIVWALARDPSQDFEVVPGDVHRSYLLMCSGHDGTMSLTFRPTDVRVVCNNTLQMALGSGADEGFKIKHTRTWADRLDAAREGFLAARAQNMSFRELMQQLAAKPLTGDQARELIQELIPAKEGKRATRAEKAQAEVLRLMEEGMGTQLSGVKGTAYGFLNAVTEYTHHARTYKDTSKNEDRPGGNTVDENKALSIWSGPSAKLAKKATKLLLAV